jgi:hypothetical protein
MLVVQAEQLESVEMEFLVPAFMALAVAEVGLHQQAARAG